MMIGKLFEYFVLDGAQAGLNWEIILKKREGYRNAFAILKPAVVARYDAARWKNCCSIRVLSATGAKSNRRLTMRKNFWKCSKSLAALMPFSGVFVDGKTIQNQFKTTAEIPAVTPEAEKMSKALVERGFKFVGPTICYAIMQSAGLVNDHLVTCFRHAELSK
jgi:DNA-3-methyladenine glycosylase I